MKIKWTIPKWFSFVDNSTVIILIYQKHFYEQLQLKIIFPTKLSIYLLNYRKNINQIVTKLFQFSVTHCNYV